MTDIRTPSTRPRLWLALGAVLTVVGIAILWPLQYMGQICILIYPAPPGCGAPQPPIAAFLGIGLLIALLAAQVVLFFTTPRPRLALILLSGGMIAVVAIAAGIVALSQTGIWDPYQPLVIID